jgi:hypothetical protein
MMKITGIVVLLGASLLATAWCLFDIWRKRPSHIFLKLGYTLVASIPLAGPLIYLWISYMPGEQSDYLKNTGPRGYYAGKVEIWRMQLVAARKNLEK